ncbi:MAG: ATP-dependent DNA helicase RecG [Firmicutes bacterium]|nr:ATP-dependent DNA helicase RecG [Bacillota bacterium]
MHLSDSVDMVHNIGKQRLKYLNNMGVFTVGDLIEHFPREYDDRSDVKEIADLEENESNTFVGEIMENAENIRIKSKNITKAKIFDDSGEVTAVWYNQPYIKNTMKKGAKFIFTGRFQKNFGRKEIVAPEFEAIDKEIFLGAGRIMPVYSVTKGISQKVMRGLVYDTLEKTKNQLTDILPKPVRMENKLCDKNFAVLNIHFPENDESFFIARKRLVFEELFVLQTALLKMKSNITEGRNGAVIENDESANEIISHLGFELTRAQKNVIEDIKTDLKSGKVMNRLIQGDVGSGKTAVAMVAAYIAIKSGYQAVLMAPTEVLARQHFENFRNVFESLGIEVTFLSGSMKKKEKEKSLENIKNGFAQMIVGTHAVIQEKVEFKKAGIAITDEQHRFGVNQRISLSQKGESPHILVMTATPIPRTLALILYGDLDISIIDELPPGRQKIDTRAVGTAYHERIYNFIKREISKGHQAYIVCPSIEEDEKREVENVVSLAEKLREGPFSSYSVGILHGKMKNDEKQLAMEEFSAGNIDILVSTTVVEVGVNVPNATVMLIENAEMFGLSQIHQLRGRVGRGGAQSYCILVSDSKNKITLERLKTMQSTSDGFEISEKDLKLRGPGEFFGTKQHGIPMLKIANLYKDIETLKLAQKAALKLLKNDKNLEKEENALLKEEITKFFENREIGI